MLQVIFLNTRQTAHESWARPARGRKYTRAWNNSPSHTAPTRFSFLLDALWKHIYSRRFKILRSFVSVLVWKFETFHPTGLTIKFRLNIMLCKFNTLSG